MAEPAESGQGISPGEKAPGVERPGSRYYILAVLLCFAWGLGFTSMKLALLGTGVYMFAWLRLLLAGLSVLLYLRLVFKEVSLGSSPPLLLINALLYALAILAVTQGIDLTTASRTAVIVYIHPLFVAVLAHFMLKGDRLGLLKLMGIALALLGIVLIFSQRLGGGTMQGDLLVLASAAIWAFQTIFIKRWLSRENPFLIAAWQGLAGFPLILAMGLILQAPHSLELSPAVIFGILYSGVVAVGFAVVLWVKLLQDYPASNLSCFLFLTPVFGVLIGHLALGDPLGGSMLLGVALVCGGIYVVNRPAGGST